MAQTILTAYAENGEVDLLMDCGLLVLSACEEIPIGRDRTYARKITLRFTQSDAVMLRQKIDSLLRNSYRRWSETALTAMAEE